MSEAPAPTEGPLSVDQAVASLLAPAAEDQAPEAPAEAAEDAQEPQGDDQTPEDASAEPEEQAEDAEADAEPEAVAPADPPKYWSKDAKEAFGNLPPELQAVVLAQEGPREEAAAKAKADAAARVAEAAAEMQKVTQLAEQLGEFLPKALETFANRWGADPDWVAFAQEHGAEAMTIAKAQHDAELSQLQKLNTAKATADEQAHTAYVKAEFERLAEIAPDLADPEKGPELRRATSTYLVEQGVDPASLKYISAAEMLLAHKARLYDELKAKAAQKPAPKPATAQKPAPVRPAAAQGGTPTSRSAVSAQNAFNSKPSRDNAIALLLAKKA